MAGGAWSGSHRDPRFRAMGRLDIVVGLGIALLLLEPPRSREAATLAAAAVPVEPLPQLTAVPRRT